MQNLMQWEHNGMAAYMAEASGERVLWLHGYSLNSTVWEDLWNLLPGWQHVAVDLPSHGRSGPMKRDADLEDIAADIGDFARVHEIRHLIGFSFGGTVALQVAIQFADQFASITLASPGLGGGPIDPQARTRNIELADLYHRRGPGPWMSRLWMTSPPAIFAGAADNARLWERLERIIDSHEWRELGQPGAQQLAQYPQREAALRTIRASLLLLIGENDMAASKRAAELIRRNVPACDRVYIPAAGHLCMLEQPCESARHIAAHLRCYAADRCASSVADTPIATT
jgi:pimeloyl-ACP methyl ester carboxylesterase